MAALSVTEEDGRTVYRFGSHSEALAAKKELGGKVVELNLWSVIVEGEAHETQGDA